MPGLEICGDSPEAVAFALMQNILLVQGKGTGTQVMAPSAIQGPAPNEEDLLALYVRCVRAVKTGKA